MSATATLRGFLIGGMVVASSAGCTNEIAERNRARRAQAEAQVAMFAAQLRQATDDTASYQRIEPAEVKERDPWGNQLSLTYTQGGVSESFEVRSLGADGRKHTADDIIESGMIVNFKGIGRAVREGVEETAENATRGVVRGAVNGAKGAIADGVAGAKDKLKGAAGKWKERLGSKDEAAEDE